MEASSPQMGEKSFKPGAQMETTRWSGGVGGMQFKETWLSHPSWQCSVQYTKMWYIKLANNTGLLCQSLRKEETNCDKGELTLENTVPAQMWRVLVGEIKCHHQIKTAMLRTVWFVGLRQQEQRLERSIPMWNVAQITQEELRTPLRGPQLQSPH